MNGYNRRYFFSIFDKVDNCCYFLFALLYTNTLLRGVCTITKTRLYSFDPLKPHFYIVKLWLTGIYIIFLFSKNIEAVLTSTHNLCFEQEFEKYQNFYLKIFLFWYGKFFNIFE